MNKFHRKEGNFRQKERAFDRLTPRAAAELAAGGFAAGVVNGVFGTGGGVLIVFLLGGMAGMLFPDRRYVFANVTAAVLPMALTSTLIYSSLTPPDPADTVTVAAASLAGGMLGALLLGKIKPDLLKKIFAIVMIASGGVMLFSR